MTEQGDDDEEREGVAFIDQQGNTHLVVIDEDDEDFLIYGVACCASSVEQEFGGSRYLKSDDEEAEITVELASGQLRGAFEFRDQDYAFSFAAHEASSQSLTLQELAGVYTRTTSELFESPVTLTIAINAEGLLTGSHSNGCLFDGSVAIPDASRNMVRFDVRIDSCGELFSSSRRWNGEYTGLGVLLRDAPVPGSPGAREDALQFSLIGPTWFGLLSVAR